MNTKHIIGLGYNLSDSELLKLAAPMAQMPDLKWLESGVAFHEVDGYKMEWNPLESDADAFRLLVAMSGKYAIAVKHSFHEGKDKTRLHRRALVCAAAELAVNKDRYKTENVTLYSKCAAWVKRKLYG